jgi:hypothetical protein
MIHSSSLKALTVFTTVVGFLANAPLLASSGWQESTKNDYETLKTQHATLEPYESNSPQALTSSVGRRLSDRRCSNERSFLISPFVVLYSLLFILETRSFWIFQTNHTSVTGSGHVWSSERSRLWFSLAQTFKDHISEGGGPISAKVAELMHWRC